MKRDGSLKRFSCWHSTTLYEGVAHRGNFIYNVNGIICLVYLTTVIIGLYDWTDTEHVSLSCHQIVQKSFVFSSVNVTRIRHCEVVEGKRS